MMKRVRIMESYQTPKAKQEAPYGRHREKGYQGDIRFRDYLIALKVGDFDACEALRDAHSNDFELMTKFRTIEQLFLQQTALYIREIQITRRERDAWKSLADGRLKKINGDRSGPSAWTLIHRGEAILAQSEEARKDHELVEIPLGFEGVGK